MSTHLLAALLAPAAAAPGPRAPSTGHAQGARRLGLVPDEDPGQRGRLWVAAAAVGAVAALLALSAFLKR